MFRLLFLFLLCHSLAARAAAFDDLAAWRGQGVAVSALAVDVETGKVLASLDADQRLTPASLSKLFTAAVSLRQWGSNKTFTTRLLSDGKQEGELLKGSLTLVGGGDPGLVSEQLWELVSQLQNKGIRRIEGDLVVDASRFDRSECVTPDRCQARHRSRHAYNAGLSSAGINYGSWCVRVQPGERTGMPARAETCPFRIPEVTLKVDALTVEKKGKALQLERETGSGKGEVLRVRGQIGLGQAPVYLFVSAGDASLQAGLLFKAQLAAAGIVVTGDVRLATQPVTGTVLAGAAGLPLATLVKRMLDWSNNYMADVLTLDLLADEPGTEAPVTLDAAAGRLQSLAATLVAPYPLANAHLGSGSGLTVASQLSATDLVELLKAMYRQTDIFPAFVGGMTVPKYSSIGILRGPEPEWQERVMVKSGSLNEPYTVYGIAGYARDRNDRWLAFAILLNGTARKPVLPYADSMQLLRRAVVAVIRKDPQ